MGALVIEISDGNQERSLARHSHSHLGVPSNGDQARDAKTVEKPISKAVQKMFRQFRLRRGTNQPLPDCIEVSN